MNSLDSMRSEAADIERTESTEDLLSQNPLYQPNQSQIMFTGVHEMSQLIYLLDFDSDLLSEQARLAQETAKDSFEIITDIINSNKIVFVQQIRDANQRLTYHRHSQMLDEMPVIKNLINQSDLFL